MLVAPIPKNEQKRLEAVRRLKLLDTPIEGRFDRITKTTAAFFHAPISTLTLVDSNREWYKSFCGLNKRQGQRAISFCGHLMEGKETLVIPDTKKDIRFKDNPMVVGPPHIRFYAGQVLYSTDGKRVGTLCVKDRKPRKFNANDRRTLQYLAKWAELEMNLHEILNRSTGRQIHLDTVLQNVGEGVYAIDKKGTVMFMNSQAEELLGWKLRETRGKMYSDIWTLQDEEGHIIPKDRRPVFMALKSGKQIENRDNFFLRRDGTRFPVAVTASPLYRHKVCLGAVVVFRDITDERRVDRAKNEFVSLASHQMLTPLSIIKWYAERLLSGADGPLNKQQLMLGNEIYESNQRLIEVVGALLDISRIETGKFLLAPQAVDLNVELKRILNEQKLIIDQKRVETAVTVSGLPNKILIDPRVFRLAAENLISNAIRYTRNKGHVRITAEKKGRRLVFTVQDDGIGIPKNQQANLFTKFFRASNARLSTPGGNGLGLYIVKTFVEMARGKVGFHSEENEGSTFFIEIPFREKKNDKT